MKKNIFISKEYQYLIEVLELIDTIDTKKRNDIIEDCLERIRPFFKDNIKIEAKRLEDKYDMCFDESYGVLLIDDAIGDMHMLYEVTGLDVKKETFEKYLISPCPYLEVYLRIISKCLKLDIESKYSEKRKEIDLKSREKYIF